MTLVASSGAVVAHHAPPFWLTLLFAGLLTAMILTLALEEKLHAKKSLITSVGAIVSLFLGTAFGILPFGSVVNVFGEKLAMPVYIPAIDWGVIAIIFGASLFVDVTAKSGLFSWIAIRLTKASGGDPFKLLLYYGSLTVVFSAVLNNVTAMLIIGSLTAVSLGKLGKRDKLLGFLLIEGLLTNVGGLLTLISSVPNIIVGQAAKIGFIDFFVVACPYVLVATVATLLAGARVFGIKRLATEQEKQKGRAQVDDFDENDGVRSKGFFWFATAMFVAFIATLATASVLPVVKDLEMGYVALAFAVIMLLRYKNQVDRFYKALDWDLILFFASLFIVINVMEHAKVLELIGHGLEQVIALGPKAGSGALLAASAGASSVTDNIPLAAVLAKILQGMPAEQATSGMWWSVVFGANLGGNITPIGSASTVVAVTIIHKYELELSFLDFVKKALPFAAVQILLAILYVVVFLS
jgi:Na+/H+ antiporter NhaD/arsenite permease-like protein